MNISIAGATGLIGSHLTLYALDDAHINQVYILVRQEVAMHHPKLKQIVVDYAHLPPYLIPNHIDALFCCLGTTMKKAGSRQAFKEVDFDYVLKLGNLCSKKNIAQMHVVSAMGAHSSSFFFYNKVKGKMEEKLTSLGLSSLNIYRPSLLLGERDEKRFGEKVAAILMKAFSFLMVGPFKNYKAIRGEKVASFMLEQSKLKPVTKQIFLNQEML